MEHKKYASENKHYPTENSYSFIELENCGSIISK